MLDVARWVDRGIAFALSASKMYDQGWGDPDTLSYLIERTADFGEPQAIEIEWDGGHQRHDGVWLFSGRFESPDMELPLPPESRTAYFQLLLPEDAFEGALPPVVVHLAGSGDSGYIGRRLHSIPLARDAGIGSVLLQNPYYGERKPADQSGTKLRRVTDQLTMNLATIEEARALLGWLRRDGYAHVGVTGYSMGGFMAAMTAQLIDFPLAVIPCAAGNTPAPTLVHSPLRQLYDWEKLDSQLRVHDSSRRLMARLMHRFAIDQHGTLAHPELAVVVGGLRDEFVPPSAVVQLYRHWKGSELRWIDAGHTTGWALHGEEMRDALITAFERLKQQTAS